MSCRGRCFWRVGGFPTRAADFYASSKRSFPRPSRTASSFKEVTRFSPAVDCSTQRTTHETKMRRARTAMLQRSRGAEMTKRRTPNQGGSTFLSQQKPVRQPTSLATRRWTEEPTRLEVDRPAPDESRDPRTGRFKPGHCPNPKGRPRKVRTVGATIAGALKAPIPVTENGRRRKDFEAPGRGPANCQQKRCRRSACKQNGNRSCPTSRAAGGSTITSRSTERVR